MNLLDNFQRYIRRNELAAPEDFILLHDSGVAPHESLQEEALPPEQTLLFLLLGCAVIAVALAVSCAAVLAKSPKSILSSMR